MAVVHLKVEVGAFGPVAGRTTGDWDNDVCIDCFSLVHLRSSFGTIAKR
jgi:hypothetical protein